MIERPCFIGYAYMMRFFIYLLLVSCAVFVNADTVYKTVDEDGNIIFTDKPSENAEEIKLKELQTIKNPNPAKFKLMPKQADKAFSYKTFLITNPADGSGLRSNNGNLTISVSLEPPLRSGHKIIITMDGQTVSAGTARSVSLQNIDRGTHSIGASVVDSSDKTISSTTSSFSLLRAN
jgi:prophage tail gpP-like protein